MAETSASAESHMRKPSRAKGSSSTISVVKRMDLHHFPSGAFGRKMIRQKHGYDGAPAPAIFAGEFRTIAIELMEVRPRVRQSDSAALRRISVGESGAVVLNILRPKAPDGK